MNNTITVVMYHYVKDVDKTPYPKIKAMGVNQFKTQIEYFEKYYKFVTIQDCIQAFHEQKKLANNSILLTFDDGYADMYNNVYPILKEKGIQGAFFIPGKPITEGIVLNVNKIQHVLATSYSDSALKEKLKHYLNVYKNDFNLNSYNYYYEKYAIADYFDSADVVFIKKMLSFVLPLSCRTLIVDDLFRTQVTSDEKSFSKSLYLNISQIKEMQANGMYIGSHGYEHFWLGEISKQEQIVDIEKSLNFLESIGSPTSEWAITYPYESYNESLIEVVKEKGCKLGFIEEERIVNVDIDDSFHLPRLDTNEFPPKLKKSISNWTEKIINE
jgi:peptidoglycan/xylan/chitin deacetylase (PgdA/CDA1 family)